MTAVGRLAMTAVGRFAMTAVGRFAMTKPAAPLVVAEFSSGIAGAYCGWLLGRMGARVGRFGGERSPGTDALALALGYLNDGKPARAGWDGADIVIIDDLGAFEAWCGEGLGAVAARAPGIVFGVASVFGLTGPLAGAAATGLDAQAVSGVAWALGEPGRAPLSIPPGVLDCQAGAHLAAACLAARFAGARPEGRIVDIALADILALYVAVNCRFYIHHGMQWQRAGRRASSSGGAYPFVILSCRDGDVCLSGRTRPEWERFVQAMGSPDWARLPRYQKLRAMGQQYPEEVDALVLPWLLRHTKAEIAAIAHEFQLTIAPLRHFTEVLETPQLHERGFLLDWTGAEPPLLAPALPFKASAARQPGPSFEASLLSAVQPPRAAAAGKPLAGLRVLDLGWVWSAPQLGSILAQLGADVIKVEHSRRLDNARMSGAIIRDGLKVDGDSTEMSPMFHQINKGKRGITLNTKLPEGVALARRLAACSDIVIENMSAGSMERSGLGYGDLSPLNPALIMVAMSGAGQFGPLADMRTYAPAMSSFAGLEALVGYAGEAPVGALNFALGDPNAAAHGLVAVFAALTRRQATGTGCYIDLSQTEALLATLTPYMLAAQRDGRQPAPMGNAHPAMAPHGIYPAAGDDRWLSIAVQTEAQWLALGAEIGEAWAGEARFGTAPGRVAAGAGLDGLVSAWSARHDRDALVARLRGAGIAASPVNDIEEFWNDAQFAARGMQEPAELPGLGTEGLYRAPWLFSGLQPGGDGRGPLLGEHNAAVLKGVLGLSDAEFDRLTLDGVIL